VIIMKKYLILIFLTVLAFGCEKKIGGDTDQYGCLIAAGYSYNETINACIRSWELDESQAEAARIAVESFGSSNGLTVAQVETLRCPGCFIVQLRKDQTVTELTLVNWTVAQEPIIGADTDEHGCKASAGYTWCSASEKCIRLWEEDCPIDQDLCESSGGHWNECSNKCQLDNQGKEGVGCTMQCEALCECGGIAGFNCPGGYDCKMPQDIADALGYCVKSTN
jgi:hypothetical protein